MNKTFLILLLFSLASGCLSDDDLAGTKTYLNVSQIAMKDLSENLNNYLNARALFNNDSMDSREAYDNAVMAYMKNEEIRNVFSKNTPPQGFKRFHSLVLSSADHFSLAYRHDMNCINTSNSTSCLKAKTEANRAINASIEAMDELELTGVKLT
ncbi:MAG: hypothetical protein ABH851_04630 [Methanobacteriota archaeon]